MRNTLGVSVLLGLALSIATGVLLSAHASTPKLRRDWVHDVRAYITGYNTVPGQTDDTPCIAASGRNICGRTDAVACPRRIGLGTLLLIRGMIYVCEDRLAKKFDARFDISCDKDADCPGKVTGWAVIRVFTGRQLPAGIIPSPAAGRIGVAGDASGAIQLGEQIAAR